MLPERVAADLAALASDPGAWSSLAVALVLAFVAWLLGHAIAQRTQIIGSDPDGWESAGIGLGIGTIALASWFAALRATGITLFAPTAILLLVAIVVGRGAVSIPRIGSARVGGVVTAALLLVVTGIIYGITVAPSPRHGLQPVEFMDEAYYAVLGSQLRATGLESVTAPAGLGELPGMPLRAWYHWGEAWLGALVESITPLRAMQARHLVVLPLLLLASAALAGGFASRFVPSRYRRETAILGAFGMLTIAPIPLVLEDHFDWWARPIGFTVTLYGLAFVVVLILLNVTVQRSHSWSWGQALAVGALASALLASHILVTATAFVGAVVATGAFWLAHRNADVRPVLVASRRPVAAVAVAGVLTLVWSVAGGYGFGERALVEGVTPYGETWWRAIGLVAAGAGVLLIGVLVAIPIRREQPLLAALVTGALAAVGVGALVWGYRLADFNSFHIFFGAIAVLLTPLALTAMIVGARSQRDTSRRLLATLGIAAIGAQGAIGIGATVQRLYEFGPGHYRPVPVAALDAIRALPADAKLAYSCDEVEEIAIWDARLISLTAHTGRPVVPMCFQVDVFGVQLRQPPARDRMSPFFAAAPQRALYPAPGVRPREDEVRTFLKTYGIDYIWVDPDHRNELVAGATDVFREGQFAVLRVP